MAYITSSNDYRQTETRVVTIALEAMIVALGVILCFAIVTGGRQPRQQSNVRGIMVLDTPQFATSGAPMQLRLQLLRQPALPVTLDLGAALLSKYDVGSAMPAPNIVSASATGTRFVFDPLGDRAADIGVSLIPKTWGKQTVSVHVAIGSDVTVETSFTQWVWP